MCKLVVKRKCDEVEFIGDYTAVIELLDKLITFSNAEKYTYTISLIAEENDEKD